MFPFTNPGFQGYVEPEFKIYFQGKLKTLRKQGF